MASQVIIREKVGISSANLEALRHLGVKTKHELDDAVNWAIVHYLGHVRHVADGVKGQWPPNPGYLCRGCLGHMELDEATQSYFCPKCAKDE